MQRAATVLLRPVAESAGDRDLGLLRRVYAAHPRCGIAASQRNSLSGGPVRQPPGRWSRSTVRPWQERPQVALVLLSFARRSTIIRCSMTHASIRSRGLMLRGIGSSTNTCQKAFSRLGRLAWALRVSCHHGWRSRCASVMAAFPRSVRVHRPQVARILRSVVFVLFTSVPPAGLEPATTRLEVMRSIHLSYGGNAQVSLANGDLGPDPPAQRRTKCHARQ